MTEMSSALKVAKRHDGERHNRADDHSGELANHEGQQQPNRQSGQCQVECLTPSLFGFVGQPLEERTDLGTPVFVGYQSGHQGEIVDPQHLGQNREGVDEQCPAALTFDDLAERAPHRRRSAPGDERHAVGRGPTGGDGHRDEVDGRDQRVGDSLRSAFALFPVAPTAGRHDDGHRSDGADQHHPDHRADTDLGRPTTPVEPSALASSRFIHRQPV